MAGPPPDPVHILHNPGGHVTSLAVLGTPSSGKTKLVSGSLTGIVAIWDMDLYRPIKTWQAHQGNIIWLGTLDDDDDHLLSHCRRESIIIWTAHGDLVHRLAINHDGFCKADLQGGTLTIPSEKNGIQVYRIASNKTFELVINDIVNKSDEGSIMAIKQSTVGLIAAYESGYVCIRTGGQVRHETRIKSMPTCVEHNPRLSQILLGTCSEILYILDDQLGLLKEVTLTNPGLNVIALRPDGRIFVTAGWDKRFRIFSATKHRKLCVLRLHDDSLNAVAFPGSLLAGGGGDAQISLWDVYN